MGGRNGRIDFVSPKQNARGRKSKERRRRKAPPQQDLSKEDVGNCILSIPIHTPIRQVVVQPSTHEEGTVPQKQKVPMEMTASGHLRPVGLPRRIANHSNG